MKGPVKRLIFWAPRVLCILFAIFVSVFALDVFGAGYSFGETVLALLMHLIPTAIIVVVLAISWRREWVGGVLFTALGALYFAMSWGQGQWFVNPIMSGPPILIGVLFLINWVYRAELRASS